MLTAREMKHVEWVNLKNHDVLSLNSENECLQGVGKQEDQGVQCLDTSKKPQETSKEFEVSNQMSEIILNI